MHKSRPKLRSAQTDLAIRLDHYRSHKTEKIQKNGSGPFSYKFFVPTRVGLISQMLDYHAGNGSSFVGHDV